MYPCYSPLFSCPYARCIDSLIVYFFNGAVLYFNSYFHMLRSYIRQMSFHGCTMNLMIFGTPRELCIYVQTHISLHMDFLTNVVHRIMLVFFFLSNFILSQCNIYLNLNLVITNFKLILKDLPKTKMKSISVLCAC